MNTNQAKKETADEVVVRGRYLRPDAAAAYLGTSPSTLAKMRLRGNGPPFCRLGSKMVAYDIEALDRHMAERTQLSTSEDNT